MEIIHDDFANDDSIGHEFAKKALVELIRATSINAGGSFTIGIYGEWGSGKTSMLRQIESEIGVDESVFTVWFNPWQFAESEDILFAFFRLFSKKVNEYIENQKSTGAIVGESLLRFGGSISKGWRSFVSGTKLGLGIPGVFKIDYSGKDAAETRAQLSGSAEDERIGEIYYDLVDFLRNEAVGIEVKFVIFIDDLDRCTPSQAIELLDGLKVLFDIPNFVFVLGLANDILEHAVKEKYKKILGDYNESEKEFRTSYMDKIIQFPFNLPRPDIGKVKSNIILPRLGNIDDSENYATLIVDVIGSNPRSLKRFLNLVAFSERLAAVRFGNKETEKPLIIKSALLAYTSPKLNRKFEENPTALVDICKKVADLDIENSAELSEDLKTGNPAVDALMDRQTAVSIYKILSGNSDGATFTEADKAAYYVRLSGETSDAVTETTHEAVPAGSSANQRYSDFFVQIPAGTTRLGDTDEESLIVNVTRNFLCSMYPVTQELYESIVGTNPSKFLDPNKPVERVSWLDAVHFANKLSIRDGLNEVYLIDQGPPSKVLEIDIEADGYRLPTEAEFQLLADISEQTGNPIDDYAWYINNSRSQSQTVGLKKANSYGVYDALGNVWEWTNDWYAAAEVGDKQDYTGPSEGTLKVCKGGSWANFEAQLSTRKRQKFPPTKLDNNIGFRLVKSI